MSDQDNPEQKFALAIIGLLVTATVAAVIGLGIWKARPAPTGEAATSATAPATPSGTGGAAAAAAAAGTVAVERLYFAVGSDALPADANDVLARVATAARATSTAVVSVSGYHDATGNVASNHELAKRRAQAVQHALEANGVAPAQIRLEKPIETTGGTDPAEARRVELRVQ